MKFTFDYEETLQRRIIIEAKSLSEAIYEIENRIENEEIVLGSEDFASGKISMPLSENTLPHLEFYGDSMEREEGLDVVVDYW